MLDRLRDLEDLSPSTAQFLEDALKGLTAPRKSLPAKYFYDETGSRLFEAICELPEYYLTRTELGILQDRADELADRVGPRARLVEFGSGAGVKVRLLLSSLRDVAAYVPVDISREYLLEASSRIADDFPAIEIMPVCADYTCPFVLPAGRGVRQAIELGFFPGSTIGNLSPTEAVGFLARARRMLGSGSAMIVGVDVPKAAALLESAYDDSQGVTAAFNLNMLARLNRELGADFRLEDFTHRALWNREAGRIEMHLVSRRDQTVTLEGQRIQFHRHETIHTENSYKYAPEKFRSMAREAGYSSERCWTDRDGLFSVHLLRAP